MKGETLPKEFWVKGKSKFLYARLREEGIDYGNNLWDGTITDSPVDRLYMKLRGQDWKRSIVPGGVFGKLLNKLLK